MPTCCCPSYLLREMYGVLIGMTTASGAGGSEPLKTTPLRFLHVLFAMKNTAAARSKMAKVDPTLTPAAAALESPEWPPWEITGLVAEAELDAALDAVVSGVVVGPAEVGLAKSLDMFLDAVGI
jgi:hypothetical protein